MSRSNRLRRTNGTGGSGGGANGEVVTRAASGAQAIHAPPDSFAIESFARVVLTRRTVRARFRSRCRVSRRRRHALAVFAAATKYACCTGHECVFVCPSVFRIFFFFTFRNRVVQGSRVSVGRLEFNWPRLGNRDAGLTRAWTVGSDEFLFFFL